MSQEESQFKPEKKKTGGRKKGTPNKTTVALKTAIMNAFEKVGGESYLETVAREDPKTFCTLLAKVLPSELKVDGDIRTTVIRKRFGRRTTETDSD